MAKAREAARVTITDDQRSRLEDIWFVFGNRGSKRTPGNHTFIQMILEQGLDIRPLFTKRTRKAEMPTPECVSAVERILGQPHAPREWPSLRLVPTPAARRPRLSLDPEVASMLESMKRPREGVTPDLQDDTPDAA